MSNESTTPIKRYPTTPNPLPSLQAPRFRTRKISLEQPLFVGSVLGTIKELADITHHGPLTLLVYAEDTSSYPGGIETPPCRKCKEALEAIMSWRISGCPWASPVVT